MAKKDEEEAIVVVGEDGLPVPVEKPLRKRGWVIYRNYEYDYNDVNGRYYKADEDTWRDGVTDEWNEIGASDGVEFMHYIFHDNDWVLDDVTNKPVKKILHAQGVIKYKNNKTQSAVQKELCAGNTRSQNVQPVKAELGGYLSACQYLTHISQTALDDEKTWYHPSNVISHGERYLDSIKANVRTNRQTKRDEKELCDELVNKIVDGDMRYYAAKELYKQETSGAALVRQKNAFEGALSEFREFKMREMLRLSDAGLYKRRTRYISGGSESGKSVLGAELIIDAVGEGEVFKPGDGGSKKITFDIADGYVDEKGLLLSDFNGSRFELMAQYNMFDPKVWSIMASRNVVKPMFYTEAVVSNAYSFGTYVCRALAESTDYRHNKELNISLDLAGEFKQFCRRFEEVYDYEEWVDPVSGEKQYGVVVSVLKEKMPDKYELYEMYESDRNYSFDENTVTHYYDRIGYVPYYPIWHSDVQFKKERARIAKILNAVNRDNLNVEGFVQGEPLKSPNDSVVNIPALTQLNPPKKDAIPSGVFVGGDPFC